MDDMPLVLRPGVSTIKSPLLNEAAISVANLIRFYGGMLQKKGGWSRLANLEVNGTSRGLHAWTDLTDIGYIASGSEQMLQVLTQGALLDISPVVASSNVLNPFSTLAGSSIVTVADPNRNPVVGDWVTVASATYIAGLVLQGDYQVASLVPGVGYTFNAGVQANATINGGGTTLQFTTQAGRDQVVVTLGAAPFVNGELLTVFVSTAVGGVTIAGPYAIVVAGGIATLNAGAPAAANANGSENGGLVHLVYPLPSLLDQSSPFVFGAGDFGAGPFGVGAGSASGVFQLREWTLDNFGQVLVANPKGGALYEWTPPATYNNVAQPVASGPQFSQGSFVAMPEEVVFSYGSDGGGFQDPMLVKFSTVGDFTSPTAWTPLATNQAGSFRLTRGSTIVGGMQSSYGGLLFTDVGLWLVKYIQPPFVWSFEEIGKGCGLLALRAAAEVAGLAIWPSFKGFWTFNGSGVSPLECEVWDTFYSSIDPQYINTLHAFPNSDFTEIAWHFAPLGAMGVPTSYINLNVGMLNAGFPPSACWDYGTLTRTAGIDRTAVGPPIGVDGPGGLFQAHETSPDADGAAMPSFAETGWFKLAGGAEAIFLERLIADFVGSVGWQVLITVFASAGESPNSPVKTFGPFTANASIEHIIPRVRGKLLKLRFDFSTLGTFARLGSILQRSKPAGRRP